MIELKHESVSFVNFTVCPFLFPSFQAQKVPKQVAAVGARQAASPVASPVANHPDLVTAVLETAKERDQQ